MSLSGLDSGVAVLSPFRSASRLEELGVARVVSRATIWAAPWDAPFDASGFSTVQVRSVFLRGLFPGAQPIKTIRARRLQLKNTLNFRSNISFPFLAKEAGAKNSEQHPCQHPLFLNSDRRS